MWAGDGPLGDVDAGALAHEHGEAATDTLDGGQRISDLLLSVNVGVEETQNVLEVVVFHNQRLQGEAGKHGGGLVRDGL